MVKKILQFILIFLLLMLLLTFESVVGLPVIFLTILGLSAAHFRRLLWWPLLILLLLSLVMAVSYQVPAVGALVLLLGVSVLNSKGEKQIERRASRIIVTVAAATLALLLMSPMGISEISWPTVFLQGLIMAVLIWRVIGIPVFKDKGVIKRLGRE